jgi:NAD(P)-dependent dehydrogenase (short-subunit alcohol dehydrogenase family)
LVRVLFFIIIMLRSSPFWPLCARGIRYRVLPPSSHLTPRRTIKTLPAFSLENKTCVVTGSARGLGKEFLTAFALSGARGACIDLSQKDCDASIASIASQVQEAYPNDLVPELRAYECNATIESDVKSTWAKVVEDFGKVDVLVTAAGIVDNVEAENYEYARWRKMMDINIEQGIS